VKRSEERLRRRARELGIDDYDAFTAANVSVSEWFKTHPRVTWQLAHRAASDAIRLPAEQRRQIARGLAYTSGCPWDVDADGNRWRGTPTRKPAPASLEQAQARAKELCALGKK
jgi:hypothetical protein